MSLLSQDTITSGKPVMFYDGGCPLCQMEVKHYQAIDKKRMVQWVDIQQQPQLLADYKITLPSAMRRLHVLDDKGKIYQGFFAFLVIWQALPYYRLLAFFLRLLPGLPWLLNQAYNRFADWRYKKRCKTDRCQC
jgi:predicted DCC family thiol-disulfide oxidoreductase YuxK